MSCSVLHCCYTAHNERVVSRWEGGYDVRTVHWYCDRHVKAFEDLDMHRKAGV